MHFSDGIMILLQIKKKRLDVLLKLIEQKITSKAYKDLDGQIQGKIAVLDDAFPP